MPTALLESVTALFASALASPATFFAAEPEPEVGLIIALGGVEVAAAGAGLAAFDLDDHVLRHRARAVGGLLRFGWKRRDHREVSEECGCMRIKNS